MGGAGNREGHLDGSNGVCLLVLLEEALRLVGEAAHDQRLSDRHAHQEHQSLECHLVGLDGIVVFGLGEVDVGLLLQRLGLNQHLLGSQHLGRRLGAAA